MENISIIIGVLTLLGGYFGIPKLIEAGLRQMQIIRIRKKAEKLGAKIIVDKDKKSIRDVLLFEEVKNLLFKAKDSMKNKEFLQKQLDVIILELYESGMYDDIQELRIKFQDYFEFSAESWANIAISNMNLYRFDGMNEFHDNSISASIESNKRRANYGIPKAVILIISMIDFERKRQVNKDDLKKMINEIISGDDTLVSYETFDYLTRTKNIGEWDKYINHLFTLFPEEMIEMEKRYSKHYPVSVAQ